MEGKAAEALSAALRPLLRRLHSSMNDIEAVAVITADGLPLAAFLGERSDSDRFGAMCASLLALAGQAAEEIERGDLRQVLVEGDDGSMLLIRAGDHAVLAVAAGRAVNIGRVFLESRKVADDVAAMVRHAGF